MPKSLHHDICDKFRFSKLYDTYAQSLGNILLYKYGDLLNPTDKVQEAFIKLWENCSKVTPESVKSYLYTTANNMMLNEVKHQKVVFKYQQVKPQDYDNESPEFILRKKEFLERFERVLSQLEEEERVAFLLNKVDGKTHKEVAEILGITKKVAEHRIYGAFKKLKNQLEELN
ncbi:RNA polymerase sigma-70 factor (ECF subfamily) [Gelidibacter algens]|jgi:RNA polymerase sigma-70 factor (ECF subfamily)|uniref:RNA polymerase sigma-70 factor (ECF subfamily) n=1 Tax=Gelidibacter algens TaxID=49280 RepID=A0A1A7R3C4_9FLAO|nr:sigma-70 family RNA polymerase sigma factor [Gelidibacter algens]OBX26008.1 RNA polymerase subunit sigma-70 [Gelidibacter algens]RAJ27728.1 RNA polymerase sigma-70 factor (ECF subfamily) [Gelidibacter algens]